MQTSSFQSEQNQVLQLAIDDIFSLWSKTTKEQRHFLDLIGCGREQYFLELYITASCNQSCQYCYLNRFGDKIYPKEIRDNKEIISNLKSFINYLIERKVYIPRLDLFSGEIWGYPLGNEVFEALLDGIANGLNVEQIVIPSNCSFCENEQLISIVDNYIALFETSGVSICFSISMDGIVIDQQSRPFNNKNLVKDNNYYTNIEKFAVRHHYGFHPMIAASTIEYQKKNYDEWIKMYQRIYPNNWKNEYGGIMQLEVRNDDWTDDKIEKFLDWLNYIFDRDIELFFDGDLDRVARYILKYEKTIPDNSYTESYIPYTMLPISFGYNCTIGVMLCVRLGDLAICPCHRTSYEKFIIGKFKKDVNKKIVGVEANNLQMANAIWRTGGITKPKCDCCDFHTFCMRGCLGAQYEENGEIFYPCETVCEMQKAKIIFCIEKYKKLNLFSYVDNSCLSSEMTKLLSFYKKTEEYNKWNPIIQKILS